jgi:hypothetical protein
MKLFECFSKGFLGLYPLGFGIADELSLSSTMCHLFSFLLRLLPRHTHRILVRVATFSTQTVSPILGWELLLVFSDKFDFTMRLLLFRDPGVCNSTGICLVVPWEAER